MREEVRTILHIQVSRHGGKQESDCNTPSLTASVVQYAMERWYCDKNYGGFVNVVTKLDSVQVHPEQEHSFCLSLCVN